LPEISPISEYGVCGCPQKGEHISTFVYLILITLYKNKNKLEGGALLLRRGRYGFSAPKEEMHHP